MRTRSALLVFFALILCSMIWVTLEASLDRSVIVAAQDLWQDPWGRATLFDAYFGFLTVYLWIFFLESRAVPRILWFLLLMSLGNIAIAVYFLRVLLLAPRGGWRALFPEPRDLIR